MSNWRPKEWKNPYKPVPINSPCTVELRTCANNYEAGASDMVEAISEEIEKVENPYYERILSTGFVKPKGIFEDCRQKILALLK